MANDDQIHDASITRRATLQASAAFVALPLAGRSAADAGSSAGRPSGQGFALHTTVNGRKIEAAIDTRTSLLDLLRERLELTGAKKGCDHGQCGACTVHVDG